MCEIKTVLKYGSVSLTQSPRHAVFRISHHQTFSLLSFLYFIYTIYLSLSLSLLVAFLSHSYGRFLISLVRSTSGAYWNSAISDESRRRFQAFDQPLSVLIIEQIKTINNLKIIFPKYCSCFLKISSTHPKKVHEIIRNFLKIS